MHNVSAASFSSLLLDNFGGMPGSVSSLRTPQPMDPEEEEQNEDDQH